MLGVSVTFEPGARTAWHIHPLGQTLIVTSGCGWVQSEGGPKEEIRPGDVVWCPPREKHWHGATSTTALTHIAILEHLDSLRKVRHCVRRRLALRLPRRASFISQLFCCYQRV